MRRSVRRCSVILGNYDSALHGGDQKFLLVSFHLLLASLLYSLGDLPGTRYECFLPPSTYATPRMSLTNGSRVEKMDWVFN